MMGVEERGIGRGRGITEERKRERGGGGEKGERREERKIESEHTTEKTKIIDR